MIAVLREAYAAVGDPFTAAAFKAWRIEQKERDRAERRFRRLPSYDVYYQRFGTWGKAIEAALGHREDEEHGTHLVAA